MDHAYKSLDVFDVLVFHKRSIKLKKLNLGEYIEFLLQYDIMIKQELFRKHYPHLFSKKLWCNAMNGCVQLSTGKTFKNKATNRAIVAKTMEFNKPDIKVKKYDEADIDPKYLQRIIHILALNYHWSKEQILKCYPDEIISYVQLINDHQFYLMKLHAVDMCDIEYYISKSQTTKSGFKKLQSEHSENRKKIMEMTNGSEIKKDIEDHKAQVKDWLKSKGRAV